MSLAPYSFYWNPALSLIGLGPNMTFSRSTTKNAFNASGVLASVSIGVPAIQYHPVTQQCQGVLIEQAATNNLLYSNAPTNSYYVASQGSISASSVLSPDNTTYFGSLVPNTTNTTHYAVNSPNVTKAASVLPFSLSAMMQQNGYSAVLMRCTNSGSSAYASARFNLTNGAGSSSTNVTFTTSSILTEQIGSAAYLCALTGQTDNTTAAAFRFYVDNPLGTESFAGNGTSGVLYSYSQLDLASTCPTSPIITAGTAVTRAADTLSVPVAAIPNWNAGQGTLVVRAVTPLAVNNIWNGSSIVASNAALVCIDDGTLNNQIIIYQSASNGHIICSTTVSGSASASLCFRQSACSRCTSRRSCRR